MSAAQRIVFLGAFFLGTAVAHKESQEVVRSDVETGENYVVGCVWSVGLYKVGRVFVLLLKGFYDTFRPGLGTFWPKDLRNDISLCDIIHLL